MKKTLYDYGYGTAWQNALVQHREGYYTSVADFHEHDFYEINLILSGNVNILLSDQTEEGIGSRIVLTKPGTPHFVSCKPDTLYSRIYLVFSKDFIENYIPEWDKLSGIFGKNGRIVKISHDQKDLCKTVIKSIQDETDLFRQRILILYLLSYIEDFAQKGDVGFTQIPPYIINALTFIDEHYSEKITAEKLAAELGISRTTLMTSFKKYTGSTLNDYIIHCRLKNVMQMIGEGTTEQEAAERCGLGDASGLIRCFKRKFGMTPKQYLVQ